MPGGRSYRFDDGRFYRLHDGTTRPFIPEPHAPVFNHITKRFVARCPHEGWYDVQQERITDPAFDYKEHN